MATCKKIANDRYEYLGFTIVKSPFDGWDVFVGPVRFRDRLKNRTIAKSVIDAAYSGSATERQRAFSLAAAAGTYPVVIDSEAEDLARRAFNNAFRDRDSGGLTDKQRLKLALGAVTDWVICRSSVSNERAGLIVRHAGDIIFERYREEIL